MAENTNGFFQRHKFLLLSLFIVLTFGLFMQFYTDPDGFIQKHIVQKEQVNSNTSSQTGSGMPDVGGPFTLVDENGNTVTEETLKGRYALIQFGYTYCPDICPTGLDKMAQAYEQLPKAAQDNLQMVFITVDPERDTVDVMKDYTNAFHDEMIGLTGSPAQVAGVTSEYLVYAVKRKRDGESDYLMDHSTYYYLMGPGGKYVMHYSHKIAPEKLAEKVGQAIQAGS